MLSIFSPRILCGLGGLCSVDVEAVVCRDFVAGSRRFGVEPERGGGAQTQGTASGIEVRIGRGRHP